MGFVSQNKKVIDFLLRLDFLCKAYMVKHRRRSGDRVFFIASDKSGKLSSPFVKLTSVIVFFFYVLDDMSMSLNYD